jgi:alkylation response protein AidB-like acyl-CoA dehydrogenase
MWPWSGIIGEGVMSVGVAAAALDSAVHLCKTKTPAYKGTALRDQQLAQFLVAKARGRVEASRDTIDRCVSAIKLPG